ncbi:MULTISPECIES: LysR family transcriptional regulator [unclassified Beijerinckia]|uniref:LysR family transcriptional regulator n=1 Tax=unclassified Beijerinckia TaxID=2638183 RepID=UPI0008978C71|nr:MULTISPECIES: LysR family transcriptional regulator [unclassified Beijerinckia]MDH7794257.1 LysR family nod box-dependent transcriptional activator [Beijerinckia sp. GAS462]SEB57015.1 LysR family transcriptional regulator, nod-box dependent transcriptional activator [Beijerinckia sp. 28-YEA-48]
MRIDNLDLNLIVALEAIVRHRSVSAAAEELGLTQPAISRALGRLRDHFNDRIVILTDRQMVPTEFGQHLFELSRRLLNETRSFAQIRPDFDPRSAKREFTVVASDFVIRVLFTKVLPRLAVEAPGISLRFIMIDTASEAMFARGEIDFCVAPDMVLDTEHPYAPLFRDEFVCIAWRDHPDIGDTLDAKTYFAQAHITTAFGVQGRDSHFERFIKEHHIELKVAVALPNFVLLPECIVGTPYLATIHERMARLLPPTLPLKIFPVPIAVPALVENLQWHRLRHHDKSTIWMRNFMLETARELDR